MSEQGKVCLHNWCALDNPIACCTCLDQRDGGQASRRRTLRRAPQVVAPDGPDESVSRSEMVTSCYPRYVDGRGMVYDAPRYYSYCFPCIEAYTTHGPSIAIKVPRERLDQEALQRGLAWGGFGRVSSGTDGQNRLLNSNSDIIASSAADDDGNFSHASQPLRQTRRLIENRAAWLERRRNALRTNFGPDQVLASWSPSLFTMSTSAQQNGPAVAATPRKSCSHDWCFLSQVLCCLCLDKRRERSDVPERSQSAFPHYLDGFGFLPIGCQEDGYCHGCATSIRRRRLDLQDGHAVSSGGRFAEQPTTSTLSPRQLQRRQRLQSRLLEAFGGTVEQIGASPGYISPLTELFEHMPARDEQGAQGPVEPNVEADLCRESLEIMLPQEARDIAQDLRILAKALKQMQQGQERHEHFARKYGLPLVKTDAVEEVRITFQHLKVKLHDMLSESMGIRSVADWLCKVEEQLQNSLASTLVSPGDGQLRSRLDDEECRVCLAKTRETIFMPCAHMVCCITCALRICEPNRLASLNESAASPPSSQANDGMAEDSSSCPYCRESIVCWTRVYTV